VSETTEATTRLNIRIDKSLKERLDDFAKSNGLPTTALVISQIERLLINKKIDSSILQPSPLSLQNKVKRDVERLA
jgi:antitoxin component of RelBE/YafQ-DinJ toxin-antitoxin module